MAKKRKYQVGGKDPNQIFPKPKDADSRLFGDEALPQDPWLDFYAQGGGEWMDSWKKAGWNVNQDMENRQVQFNRGTGQYSYHPAFSAFNPAAQLTTGLANRITDVKNNKDEYRQWVESLQPRAWENMDEQGLNDLPAYAQFGAALPVYRGPKHQTKASKYTPTGRTSEFNLSAQSVVDAYKQAGIDIQGKSAREVQAAIYDHFLKNDPETLRRMWAGYGNTNRGEKGRKASKLNWKNAGKFTDEELRQAREAYIDGHLGARTIMPAPKVQFPVEVPKKETPPPPAPAWKYGPEARYFVPSNSVGARHVIGDARYKIDPATNQPVSVELKYVDDTTGRATGESEEIPYDVWANEMTHGTNTVQDASRLKKFVPRRQTGGAVPQQYRRLSAQQMTEWNGFLDYVKQKGLQGSQDLDQKDKNLGQSLFSEYAKTRPGLSIDYSWVPDVQNEYNLANEQVKRFTGGKYLSADPSKVDGWFGHRTSQQYFIPQTTQTYHNGALQSTSRDGLLDSSLKPVGGAPAPAALPKPKAAPRDEFDPVTGDLIIKQFGGPAQLAELESGETFQTVEGGMQKVPDQAPMHEQGGVVVDNAARVLENTSDLRKDKKSRALRLDPDMVEMLTGHRPKGEMSHAAAHEFVRGEVAKDTKKIEAKLKKNVESLQQAPTNKYAQNSLRFNESQLQTQLSEGEAFDNLFEHQELLKQHMGIQNGQKGKFGGRYTVAQYGEDLSFPENSYSRPAFGGGERYYFDEATQRWYAREVPPTVEGDDGTLYVYDPATGSYVAPPANVVQEATSGRTSTGNRSKAILEGRTGESVGSDAINPATGQPWGVYSGGRTAEGRRTPSGRDNAFSIQGGLDAYKDIWSPYLDLSKYQTAAEAQGAVYDFLLENAPEAIDQMWNDNGLTAQGRKSGKFKALTPDGKFNNRTFTPEERRALREAYVDNMLGVRALTPANMQVPIDVPKVSEEQSVPKEGQPAAGGKTAAPQLLPQPKSRFNEPLRWYDVAPDVAGMLEGRIPVNYNPVELEQIRLKKQNPLPTLQAGQRDYNAALDTLPQNSQGYANQANLFSKKYGIDAQVLGQYENINAGIDNDEIIKNAAIRQAQASEDQKAREVFEQKWLMSKEAQRQQHAESFKGLTQKLAENAALNRNGNLMLKMFPAFDAYGEYNGYQVPLRRPMGMGQPTTQMNPNTDITRSTSRKPVGGMMVNGKFVPFKNQG